MLWAPMMRRFSSAGRWRLTDGVVLSGMLNIDVVVNKNEKYNYYSGVSIYASYSRSKERSNEQPTKLSPFFNYFDSLVTATFET